MTEEKIQEKINRNRDLINTIVCSDEDPTLKKILITQLAKSNKSLINQLKLV